MTFMFAKKVLVTGSIRCSICDKLQPLDLEYDVVFSCRPIHNMSVWHTAKPKTWKTFSDISTTNGQTNKSHVITSSISHWLSGSKPINHVFFSQKQQSTQPPESPDFRPVKVIAHCHGNRILESPQGEVEGAFRPYESTWLHAFCNQFTTL